MIGRPPLQRADAVLVVEEGQRPERVATEGVDLPLFRRVCEGRLLGVDLGLPRLRQRRVSPDRDGRLVRAVIEDVAFDRNPRSRARVRLLVAELHS